MGLQRSFQEQASKKILEVFLPQTGRQAATWCEGEGKMWSSGELQTL
jgi:hypothetical protein